MTERERAEQRLAEEFAKWYVPRRSSSAPEVVGWWREQALSREMENERLKEFLNKTFDIANDGLLLPEEKIHALEDLIFAAKEALGE